MGNELEIVVKTTDQTDFAAIHAKTKSAGDGIKDTLTKAGGEGATGFGMSFSQKIGPLLTKAPIHPALIGAVASAGPTIAILLSQAITVGAAGGAVALGAALSAQNPRVAGQIESLKAHIGSELRISAQPFVPAMLMSIERAKVGIRTLRPELDRAFAKASTYLDPLVEGALGFVQNALPGFRKMVESAEPLVDILRDELPELGKDFADTLETIGEVAADNADEFRLTLDAVGLIVQYLGAMVSLMDLLGSGPLRVVADIFGETPDKIDAAKEATEAQAEATETLAEQMKAAAQTADELVESMRNLVDQNIDAAEASISYREELEKLKEAIDDKKAISLEEEAALVDLAKAGNDWVTALDAQGASTEELSAKERQIREDFIRTAIRMGHSRTKAEELADAYLQIPSKVRTSFETDDQAARRRIREYKELLASVSRTITTNFNAGTRYTGLAHGGIRGAQDGAMSSGLTMVGEHGPELLSLPPGTHVMSNPDTQRMMSNGMGGKLVLEVAPVPGWDSRIMNEIIQGLIFTIRTQGNSDPQSFLSGGRA